MFILCLALVFTMEGGHMLSLFAVTAEAVENSYSNVLDDLKKDPNFNPDHYPAMPGYSTIDIIQIAESESGELFIYTYQPGNETEHYRAMYMNMSLQHVAGKDIFNELYSLTWLNNDGVFDKYLVDDFKISSDAYRYYNISSIYRQYDSQVDSSTESVAVDGISCKSFSVAQLWCVYSYNDVLVYEMEEVNVVEYTNWASGSVYYDEGFKLYLDRCDSHYIAFSVDNFKVDKIFDADITYTVVGYSKATGLGLSGEAEEVSNETITRTLTQFDTGSNDGDGLLGKTFTWDRICSTSKFISYVQRDSKDEFSDSEMEGLLRSQYVFRFLETPNTATSSMYSTVNNYSVVTNIGILRLHFLSEGNIYNLGCVGDLVEIDDKPELGVDASVDSAEIIASIILILLLLILFAQFLPYVKFILDSVLLVIKTLLELLISVLMLPIRLISKK